MPSRDPPTRARTTPAGTETGGRDDALAQEEAAIAALIHRLNGGLNNAAMAFELSCGAGADSRAERTLHTGLAGVEQAARAVALLDQLVRPREGSDDTNTGPYLRDVCDMLRAHAARGSHNLHDGFDPARLQDLACTPGAAAACLTAGLAAIAHAAPDALLEIALVAREGGYWLEVKPAGR
jgi:hypothetical protein